MGGGWTSQSRKLGMHLAIEEMGRWNSPLRLEHTVHLPVLSGERGVSVGDVAQLDELDGQARNAERETG